MAKKDLLTHVLAILRRHRQPSQPLSPDSAGLDGVGKVVFMDLLNVEKCYKLEVKRLQSKQQVLTTKEKSIRLLYLFQKDLMPGICGQILEGKEHRDHAEVQSVSLSAKHLAWVFLAVMNGAMLFYIFLFAVSQDEYRQSAWAQSFALWLAAEICLVSTCMVLFTHVLIPSVIMKDVQAIKSKLADSLVQYHQQLQQEQAHARWDHNGVAYKQEAAERLPEEESSAAFNAAEYLMVSVRLARAFPQLKTAKIIAHYHTVWPRQSYQHVVDMSQAYDGKFSALKRSASMVLVFFLGGLLTVPLSIQDMVLQMATTAVTGYTFLIHVQLFNIYPVLVVLPTLCILVLVHFWMQTQRKHQKAAFQLLLSGGIEKTSELPVGHVPEGGDGEHVSRGYDGGKHGDSDDERLVRSDVLADDGGVDGAKEENNVEYSEDEQYVSIHQPRLKPRSLPAIFTSSSSSVHSDSDDDSNNEDSKNDRTVDVYVAPAPTTPAPHQTRRLSVQMGVQMLQLAQSAYDEDGDRDNSDDDEDVDGEDQENGYGDGSIVHNGGTDKLLEQVASGGEEYDADEDTRGGGGSVAGDDTDDGDAIVSREYV